ncbi:MAG TPA: A/G-specific adenine glycosylase, partial [Opitutaceae bacterium]|nr:A/G-specific adenine glycosylase [Opitutaceae bacterium]
MPTSNSSALPGARSEFQSALLAWYRTNARALPWRSSPSLYKTVVSEFMLQQTQVKTVLPYFARWLTELPDWAALAAAPESRVLKLWEGLGYYSRPRNLHRLAQALAAMPAPPRTPAAWRDL